MSNFPTALDTNTELYEVTDGVTTVQAAHHNSIKDAVIAIEQKLGIYSTAEPTSIDYRLGHPSYGHNHNGASGMAPPINPSNIPGPSGAAEPDLHEHLMNSGRHVVPWYQMGSIPSGPSLGMPIVLGRSFKIESVQVAVRKAPSGGTTAFDVRIGATSLWYGATSLRPILPAGSALYASATVSIATLASGVLMRVDVDAVGSNDPGQDLSVFFVFRD